MREQSAIVIGAGIVGLAIARALAEKGYKNIQVFERSTRAVGASIRNFGMLWPVGQPDGTMYRRAIRTREIWREICTEAGLWHEQAGSLHLAYHPEEVQVMEEFAATAKNTRPVELLTAAGVQQKTPAANTAGLLGGLWSADEMIIESRVAIEKLPAYLTEKYGIVFRFGVAVTAVNGNTITAGGKPWQADEIYVCSGADFETLYPEVFAANHFTKCKLQMMRLVAQPDQWRIGPSLCGGLSLVHYKSFEAAASWKSLKARYEATMQEYLQWGIHVMISQNGESEITVGDSHEYGDVHDPFDKQFINDMIMDYLKKFTSLKSYSQLQSWQGIYPKRTNGATEFVQEVAPGVTVVNGLGGAGMTLSFGLAEEIIHSR
jgi:FAD dependent oxidoreductase TIGR03364